MSETLCESCNKEIDGTPKTFKRFDTLCGECYVRESTAFINASVKQQVIIPQAVPDITKREEFFTAETEAINEIQGTPFERAQKIRERITSWRMILFEAQSKEYQAYRTLQELASQLSKEEKDLLQVQDVSYTPSTGTAKPKATKEKVTERLSKEDKSLLQMAQIVFGTKLNKLDEVNKLCFRDHPDWWNNGAVIFSRKEDYNQYVLNSGAMTREQAIEAVKASVRGAKAKTFQELAEGKRALSDPLEADSDRSLAGREITVNVGIENGKNVIKETMTKEERQANCKENHEELKTRLIICPKCAKMLR